MTKKQQKQYEAITTQDEARQFAIDFQHWQENQKMYWSEVAEWADVFQRLADKYNLQDEFMDNGLI